jgi:hypothetical protein
MIQPECQVLEGPAGELHWMTCLEIAGSDGIWSCVPMFFLAIWFQRERGEALLSVTIMGHILWSIVKAEAENDMEQSF